MSRESEQTTTEPRGTLNSVAAWTKTTKVVGDRKKRTAKSDGICILEVLEEKRAAEWEEEADSVCTGLSDAQVDWLFVRMTLAKLHYLAATMRFPSICRLVSFTGALLGSCFCDFGCDDRTMTGPALREQKLATSNCK